MHEGIANADVQKNAIAVRVIESVFGPKAGVGHCLNCRIAADFWVGVDETLV